MKKIWDWLKESYHYAGDYVIPTEDGRMENRWNLTFQKTQFALYFLFGLVGLAWLVDRWTGSNLFASDFSDAELIQCKFSNTHQAKNPLHPRSIAYDYQDLPSRVT